MIDPYQNCMLTPTGSSAPTVTLDDLEAWMQPERKDELVEEEANTHGTHP